MLYVGDILVRRTLPRLSTLGAPGPAAQVPLLAPASSIKEIYAVMYTSRTLRRQDCCLAYIMCWTEMLTKIVHDKASIVVRYLSRWRPRGSGGDVLSGLMSSCGLSLCGGPNGVNLVGYAASPEATTPFNRYGVWGRHRIDKLLANKTKKQCCLAASPHTHLLASPWDAAQLRQSFSLASSCSSWHTPTAQLWSVVHDIYCWPRAVSLPVYGYQSETDQVGLRLSHPALLASIIVVVRSGLFCPCGHHALPPSRQLKLAPERA
jgi:hypothetical protein